MERSVIDRIRQYAGKDRKQVVNPNITAREAILIADHIQEIESSLESHHRDLLKIHRVAAAVAQVEPITEDDTLTVKRVKQMAMLINQLSPVHEMEPVARVQSIRPMECTAVVRWKPEQNGHIPDAINKIGAELFTRPPEKVPENVKHAWAALRAYFRASIVDSFEATKTLEDYLHGSTPEAGGE